VKTPYFNKDLIREPYTDSYKKLSGKIRTNTKGRFGNKKTIYDVHQLGALPRDVIKTPLLSGSYGRKERINGHPTQKPLFLCEKLIKSNLRKDNLLIVPFAGSGSECVAAKNLNVPFIGFEINRNFVALSTNRLNLNDIKNNI
jgi:site-specific DNA-methyltransferase (adenine-specific)